MITSGDLQKMTAGVHTTVTASDEVDTELAEVLYVTVALMSDPESSAAAVTAAIPDQVASPGKITVRSWASGAGGDATRIARTGDGLPV
jgi:hypothetical protein